MRYASKLRVERLRFIEEHRRPFGAADHRPGKVQGRDRCRAAWQDEAGERRQAGIHGVDLALEALDLGRDDAQCAFDFARSGDVGAKVEHVVLDADQIVAQLAGAKLGDGATDRGIGFIDIADRGHPRARLAHPAAVDEAGAAAVAGAGVDLVELDHEAAPNATSRRPSG